MNLILTDKERQAVHDFVDKLIDNGFLDATTIPIDDLQFEAWWKEVKSKQETWEALLIYNNKDKVPQA
jgi:uncharacterized protein YdaT